MNHYQSWSALKQWLESQLCDSLKDQVTYFLTRYHDVHNAYGRAAIRINKKDKIIFSWIEMYHQELDSAHIDDPDILKQQWDENCTYCEWDFLNAVLTFKNMSIQEAIASDNYLIKVLAIMDRRVGKRTLEKIYESKEYEAYPSWVKIFYDLRFVDLIHLKPMTRALCHQLYQDFENDEAIYMDITKFQPYQYDEVKVNQYFDHATQPNRIYFAMMLHHQVIGELHLKNITDHECTLSIHLQNDKVKSKGYGTKAEQLAIQYAFDVLHLDTIFADVVIKNQRSAHILEKLGFVFIKEDTLFRYYRLDREEAICKS